MKTRRHRTDQRWRADGSQPDPKISVANTPSASSSDGGLGKEYGQTYSQNQQAIDRVSEKLATMEGRSGIDRGKRSAFKSRLYSLESENGRGESSSDLKRRIGELEAQVTNWIKDENERSAPNVNRQEVAMDESTRKALLKLLEDFEHKFDPDWSKRQKKAMKKVGLLGDPPTYEIKRGPPETYSWAAPMQEENLPAVFKEWKDRQIAKFQEQELERKRIKKWLKEAQEAK